MTHARASALRLAAALFLVGDTGLGRAQIVLVADGAGDFRCCSTMLRRAAGKAGSAVGVETFVWSHGYRRSIADQVDAAHARLQGQRLAAEVRARQAADPGARISLAGHSAGAAVVVAASEHLPADSLACIVLLAPSVPVDTDLSAALRASRGGVHVFYSPEDRWMMHAVTCLEVFKSGRRRTPAGIAGFQPPGAACADDAYARLRNYPWNPTLTSLGHDGGHFGGYQPAFVQAFILPLLARSP